MPVRCAILDDYQNVALAMADWSKVKADAEIKVFNEPFASADEAAKALAGFDILCIMRERTPFPRAMFEKLPGPETHRHHRHAQCRDRPAGGQGSQGDRLRHGFGRASDRRTDRRADDRSRPQDQPRECAHEVRRAWQATVGGDLHGKTLGILGLGRLGQRVAKVGLAFGMKVIAWSQNLTPEKCREAGVEYATKDELLRQSDFITIHMVLERALARPDRRA